MEKKKGFSLTKPIAEKVADCGEDDYAELLYKLATHCLNEGSLKVLAGREKRGSIYKCDGPFHFCEYDDEDDDECNIQ